METVAVFDFVIGFDDKKNPLYYPRYYKLILYPKGLSILPAFFGNVHIGNVSNAVEEFAEMVDEFVQTWNETEDPRVLLREMKALGYVKKIREFVLVDDCWVPKDVGDWKTKI